MTQEKIQLILRHAVRVFGSQEWFRDVNVFSAHETTGDPTIEFKVNYIPVMEQKNVISFSRSAGASCIFTVVDKDGKKA